MPQLQGRSEAPPFAAPSAPRASTWRAPCAVQAQAARPSACPNSKEAKAPRGGAGGDVEAGPRGPRLRSLSRPAGRPQVCCAPGTPQEEFAVDADGCGAVVRWVAGPGPWRSTAFRRTGTRAAALWGPLVVAHRETRGLGGAGTPAGTAPDGSPRLRFLPGATGSGARAGPDSIPTGLHVQPHH